jgi:hypothetical protein
MSENTQTSKLWLLFNFCLFTIMSLKVKRSNTST